MWQDRLSEWLQVLLNLSGTFPLFNIHLSVSSWTVDLFNSWNLCLLMALRASYHLLVKNLAMSKNLLLKNSNHPHRNNSIPVWQYTVWHVTFSANIYADFFFFFFKDKQISWVSLCAAGRGEGLFINSDTVKLQMLTKLKKISFENV